MTQEEKDLLLKDLCYRIPYGVKVKIQYYDDVCELQAIYSNGATCATRDIEHHIETYFEECKPYLFPLSSMTWEQECQYREVIASSLNHYEVYDWFHKNHFDYRGLIPMGLANDATNKNIY